MFLIPQRREQTVVDIVVVPVSVVSNIEVIGLLCEERLFLWITLKLLRLDSHCFRDREAAKSLRCFPRLHGLLLSLKCQVCLNVRAIALEIGFQASFLGLETALFCTQTSIVFRTL